MSRKKIVTLLCLALWWALPAYAAQAIQAFEPDGMARIVASQKGKPFVLMVWSLDCEFCQASLDTLAREKRKHRNLRIVTLSTDSLEDEQAAALMRKKLGLLGLNDHAWAFGAAPPEQLRYAIDSKWHGEMPRSYWFDARGGRTAYSGVITSEIISKFIAR